MLLIKKFVKVYPKTSDVPTKYKNLRKNVFVKAFRQPFLNIPEILVREYNLKWDDKIIVFHVKEIPNSRGWKRFRTPFKKVYYGTVKDFKSYLKQFNAELKKKRDKKRAEI